MKASMNSFAAAAVGRNILLKHVSESECAGGPIGLGELGGDASGEIKSLGLGVGAAIGFSFGLIDFDQSSLSPCGLVQRFRRLKRLRMLTSIFLIKIGLALGTL